MSPPVATSSQPLPEAQPVPQAKPVQQAQPVPETQPAPETQSRPAPPIPGPGVKPRSGYLPTLDGWRAVAILAVMFFHSSVLHLGPIDTGWLYSYGEFGVQIFFAISGLLICTRLLEEEAKTGSLHLKGFYIRRVLRIQPAAWTLLAALVALKLIGVISLSWGGWWAGLLLVRNYLPWNAINAVDWTTSHFWSLSVEEHFYLMLPAFLLLVRRRRVALLLASMIVLLAWNSIVARMDWLGPHGFHRTDLALIPLILPAWLAILLRGPGFRAALERWLVPAVGVLIALACLLPVWTGWHHAIKPLAYLAPPALVLSTTLHPRSLLGRLLEWAPLKFIGRISYGLYLWQQLFFSGHYAPNFHPFGPLSHAPWNFFAVFALATLSFYLIEQPCVRLGHRLAKPAVEGRPELAAIAASRADSPA